MKKIILLALSAFIAITLIGCNQNPNEDYCIESGVDGTYVCEKRTTSYFDTTISLKLYYTENDKYDPSEIFDYFQEQLIKYHQYFDKYNEYEDVNNVYSINHADGEITIDQELFDAIEYGIDNSNIIMRFSPHELLRSVASCCGY